MILSRGVRLVCLKKVVFPSAKCCRVAESPSRRYQLDRMSLPLVLFANQSGDGRYHSFGDIISINLC